jgi:aminopeptidase N
MLRRLLGDPKFFRLLAEVRSRYEYRRISTEEFRDLAAKFLPPVPQDPNLENFFHQWVYSTGIPSLKLEYKVSGKAPRIRVTGVVRQSGVSDEFSALAPVEVHFPGRHEKTETRVATANGEVQFSLLVPLRPSRVLLDPQDSVLAVKP